MYRAYALHNKRTQFALQARKSQEQETAKLKAEVLCLTEANFRHQNSQEKLQEELLKQKEAFGAALAETKTKHKTSKEKLKNELIARKQELTTVLIACEQLKTERDELIQQIKILQQQAEQDSHSLSSAQARLQVLEQQLQHTQSLYQEKLEQQLQHAQTIATQKQELSSVLVEKEKLKMEKEEIAQKIQNLQTQTAEKTDNLASTQSRIETLEQELQQTQQLYQQKMQQQEQHTQIITTQKQELSNVLELSEKIKTERDLLVQQIEGLEKQAAQDNESLSSAKSRLANLEQQLQQTQTLYQEKLDQQTQTIATQKQEFSVLLEEAKLTHKNQEAKLQTEILAQNQELQAALTVSEKLKTERDELKQQIGKLEEQAAQDNNTLSAAHLRIENLEQQLKHTHSLHQENEQLLKSTQEKLQSQQQYTDRVQELTELRQRCEALRETNEHLRESNERLKERLIENENFLRTQEGKVSARFEKELAATRCKCAQAEADRDDLEASLQTCKRQLQVAKEQNALLRSYLEEEDEGAKENKDTTNKQKEKEGFFASAFGQARRTLHTLR